ncbi:MAG: ATP-dependent Clp protease adapter ClpS [Bdellovibrionaceae bacterium]|nr:ATP-dependent Clp protease adapter ClpS [Pseudobdellovibrionaceae bacterium]
MAGPGSRRDDEGGESTGGGTETITRSRTKTKAPSLYRVVLLNDDFTPMEFVIHVLQKFFQKDYTEATRIMLQVHHQGAGVAGTFSHEIAETKVHLVNQYSRQNKHPLKCTMDEV